MRALTPGRRSSLSVRKASCAPLSFFFFLSTLFHSFYGEPDGSGNRVGKEGTPFRSCFGGGLPLSLSLFSSSPFSSSCDDQELKWAERGAARRGAGGDGLRWPEKRLLLTGWAVPFSFFLFLPLLPFPETQSGAGNKEGREKGGGRDQRGPGRGLFSLLGRWLFSSVPSPFFFPFFISERTMVEMGRKRDEFYFLSARRAFGGVCPSFSLFPLSSPVGPIKTLRKESGGESGAAGVASPPF